MGRVRSVIALIGRAMQIEMVFDAVTYAADMAMYLAIDEALRCARPPPTVVTQPDTLEP